jgi:tRNA (guanine37-N1)-methyltransferase
MIFHVLTIFPDFFRGPLDHGVVAKARQAGKLEIRLHDLRDWTHDKHRTVDDRPFGGGAGMVMKAEPIFAAVEQILDSADAATRHARGQRIALMTPQGRLFGQATARRWAMEINELLLICGRYEGVDERVGEHLADEEISIGDYVLSGGELAACVVLDAAARLLPGVLGNEESAVFESFEQEVLDCPHWTRPADFRGWKVPEILLNGNHAEIAKWRIGAAREKTGRNRPDLLAKPDRNTIS